MTWQWPIMPLCPTTLTWHNNLGTDKTRQEYGKIIPEPYGPQIQELSAFVKMISVKTRIQGKKTKQDQWTMSYSTGQDHEVLDNTIPYHT